MIGRSTMRKVFHRHWYVLILFGLVLLADLLATSVVPDAFAATRHKNPEADKSGDCTVEHAQPAFGNTVVVNSGEVICSNLTSWGSNIIINGEVRGNVVAFGGDIIVAGKVDGTIRSYAGTVTLRNGSQVYGDIHLCGGQRTQDSASQLYGSVVDCPKSIELFLAGDGGAGTGFNFWTLLTWVALGIILTSLLPEHVMLVRTTARSKMRRSLLLGVLSVLLAPAVLAVLVALIISIPLAIIVTIGLIAGWALGTVSVGWLLGDYIIKRVAPQYNTRPLQVTVGLAVLALAGSLPYIGWFISIGVGLLGLGAVFLSRFGTRLYSQPKHPLPL
jgi:hypothetical protein